MASAAAAKKWPRFSQRRSSAGPTNRRYASSIPGRCIPGPFDTSVDVTQLTKSRLFPAIREGVQTPIAELH